MARDDYFVIVYQLLKYLYDCLKAGIQPSIDKLNATYFNINEKYWNYVIKSLLDYGFITGINKIDTKDGLVFSNFESLEITPLGIQYLYENSMIEKVKKTLKDIKEITPFV